MHQPARWVGSALALPGAEAFANVLGSGPDLLPWSRTGSEGDFGAEELLRLLGGHRDASPHHCVDTVVDALADDAGDDVVTVAVQPL